MSEKHTPGPWKVVRGGEADDWGISRFETPEPFMDIAQMVGEDDADLIAAAPEMYEALKWFAKYFLGKARDLETVMLTIAEDPSTIQEVQEKVEAALKKAEGEVIPRTW